MSRTYGLQRFLKLYCDPTGRLKPASLWTLLIDGQDAEAFELAINHLHDDQPPSPPPGAQTWLHELARHGRDHPSSLVDERSPRGPISLADRWKYIAHFTPEQLYDDLLTEAAQAQNKTSARSLIEIGANADHVLARVAQAQNEAAVALLKDLGADTQAAYQNALASGLDKAAARLCEHDDGGLINAFIARCARDPADRVRLDKIRSVITEGEDRVAFRAVCGLMSAGLLPAPKQGREDWLLALAHAGTEPPPGPDTISLAERINMLRSFSIPLDLDTLLLCAARRQNSACARALIACGADATSVLYRLAQTPDQMAMACLIEQNASPSAAYHMATRAGHGTAMQALLLITPDQGGMERLLAQYLDTDAARRARTLHRQADLIEAARNGDLDAIRQQRPDGRELSAALFSACRTQAPIRQGFFDFPESKLLAYRKTLAQKAQDTLLQAGANPSDALWLAFKHRDTLATQALLNLGASTEDGLASAAANGDLKTAAMLAWHGANLAGIIDEANQRLDERLLNALVVAGLAHHAD